MSEYTEFKALAEAFPDYDYDSNDTPFFNGPSGESLGGESTGLYCVYGPDFEIEGDQCDGVTLVEATTLDQAKFICKAKSVVLALIAENERLTGFVVHRRAICSKYYEAFVKGCGQRDYLKAENEALRKDAERYQWLRRNGQVEAWEYLSTLGEEFRDEVIDAAIKKEAEFFAGEGHAKQS